METLTLPESRIKNLPSALVSGFWNVPPLGNQSYLNICRESKFFTLIATVSGCLQRTREEGIVAIIEDNLIWIESVKTQPIVSVAFTKNVFNP